MPASRLLPFLALAVFGLAQPPDPYTLIISGGRIVDGTGNPWFYGDLAISGDRIARITPAGLLRDAPARERIDGAGLVVAPGFIDIQSGSGNALLSGNEGAISHIAQDYDRHHGRGLDTRARQ